MVFRIDLYEHDNECKRSSSYLILRMLVLVHNELSNEFLATYCVVSQLLMWKLFYFIIVYFVWSDMVMFLYSLVSYILKGFK